MSSTNRGATRRTKDRYYTRYPCALAICERLQEDGIILQPTGSLRLLEPSCGKGAFVQAMHDVWGQRAIIEACDLTERGLQRSVRPLVDRLTVGDFRQMTRRRLYDGIVGNPPFAEAEEHVRHAIRLLRADYLSAVCFLLRLNFLSGIDRQRGLYKEHPPEVIYPLDKRPPFLENNGTDSCEYGVFVWRKTSLSEHEPRVRFLRWSHYAKKWQLSVEKKLDKRYVETADRLPEVSP